MNILFQKINQNTDTNGKKSPKTHKTVEILILHNITVGLRRPAEKLPTPSNASSSFPLLHVGQLTESRLRFLALFCEVGWSSGQSVDRWILSKMAQTNSVSQNSNGETDDSPNTLVYRKKRLDKSHSVLKSTESKAQWEHGTKQQQSTKRKWRFYLKVEAWGFSRPSLLQSSDIVQWLVKNLNIDDPVEALHLGTLMAAHGYFFPISDHVLTLKDDGTFYRFQTPYFWPSNCWEPENTDYAVYLCKRTMQNKARLELADYEARAFARKWEFIFMQAEAQAKVDKKRDKIERKILDSQERAFWDVHRPVSVYGLQNDIRSHSPTHTPAPETKQPTVEELLEQIKFWQAQLDRHRLKMSKVAEGFWLAVQELKKRPIKEVPSRVQEIWQEFLAPGAPSAINVDSKSYDKTTQNVKDPGRYAFEDAQEHIYKLMKSDSYSRFIRSSAYQELLQAKKKGICFTCSFSMNTEGQSCLWKMFWKLALPAILACTVCASMDSKKPRPQGSIPSPYKLKGNQLLSSSSIMLSSLPQQPSSRQHKGKQEVLLSSREALVVTERKYLKSDWCKTQPLRQTINLEGCLSQTFINHFCYGQCNSFYIPRHLASANGRHGRKRAAKSNQAASFQSCAFCKPHRISTLTVRLHCPRLQPPYRHRKIQRIKECRCMSVNVNDTY
ncbi:Regulator of G-protein signaling 7 [Bagarius yarrelli]|uniref:Regulator of G-protein signaling 7 n=1 Tax=Bagarius yarrelli TaxID=175774 RepID=A0A556V2Y0_BAGYA|nr:Regulator of G-protein signaling 7 [Bagarius yarrelli]